MIVEVFIILSTTSKEYEAPLVLDTVLLDDYSYDDAGDESVVLVLLSE